ncbi:MAG: choice-of-anchor Q domain-containing protein, partial [Actinomycetota bacterium]|nr:choice-of-anchor Q domain-containing protein [Actinomycetota bacterium]
GGRYGASAGTQLTDAFGNLLGTTYDELGNPVGFESLVTGPDGRLTIKNLAPGKYGIIAVPPTGQGWQQTSTIEGTKVIDAWVEADEPPFFAEFGPPGFHVFIGFVKEFNEIPGGAGATITGQVVNQHLSRPPDYAFYNGACPGHTTPWIGLNDLSAGIGKGIYAAETDANCNFSIPDVPDGNYQLVVWDDALDLIFAFKGVSIVDGQCNSGSCDLGEVPVFQWFHRQEHFVFFDANGNGVWDADEGPYGDISLGINLRWRDGTIYQANTLDFQGGVAFDQVFPFFSWLVAEVGFTRGQATGVTVVADNGGSIPASVPGPSPDDDLTFGRALNPQDQTNPPLSPVDPTHTETTTYRAETGPVLTEAFQGFIGQTNAFMWGKGNYSSYFDPSSSPPFWSENGGISGFVNYAVTRAENDPTLAVTEVWEPGIPGVTVNLYDEERTTLLATTTTDSWDDSNPTDCKWGNGATGPFEYLGVATDCYDGLRNFNQVRPGVFDGGYAFGPEISCDDLAEGVICDDVTNETPDGLRYLKSDGYVVEVVAPPGYEIIKPEDKNVDFGDEYVPTAELAAAYPPSRFPACVGEERVLPPYLTLFPDEQIQTPFTWLDTDRDGVKEYVETLRPLCDRKEVFLSNGENQAVDFSLFTEVPVAAHGVGFILDDTQNEFDPNSPQFGEKYAPPFVPVTIRDWTGRIIGNTLSDQYGRYNFLAPSTATTNLPSPSGMSPNMLTTCMNDRGDDPNNPDPNFNPLYSTFCYTFQYMPGVTTYLDTPVVPVAAFAGPDQFPLDSEFPDGTPRIDSVDVGTNGVGGGPYIPALEGQGPDQDTWFTVGDQTITINSMGEELVTNPDYCNVAAGDCPTGADTVNKVITRDYGFGGGQGTVTLGELGDLTVDSWSDATIVAIVPDGTPIGAVGGRQLTVTRGNDLGTVAGVTIQMGLRQGAQVTVVGPPTGGVSDRTIQDAIDAAKSNDLILVRPGTYNEMVIMWKPVQLQGFGEGSTTINAVKAPATTLATWRATVEGLIADGNVDLLPGQTAGGGAPEPETLFTEEGAGVLVLARSAGGDSFDQNKNQGARVDGFTIRGADTGGGIVVNGYGDHLDITNNRVSNNSGFYGGGIRVGHPELITEQPDGQIGYTDADNDFVTVRNNQVVFNGGLGGAGGGISMYTGSDAYQVTDNWVSGNFSLGGGGGIGHQGLSDGIWKWQGQTREEVGPVPLIADNVIIFNESFFQGQTVSGGGIFIGGGAPLTPGTLSPGAGNVQVISNLVQGNSAGAGDGGGIRLALINGQDVSANPANTPPGKKQDPAEWYAVDVFNNLIVNNVAGLAGGGVSLQDAVNVRLVHNSIANNDSLATAGEAFAPNSPNESTPQPGAGIVARVHSPELGGIAGAAVGNFSDPAEFADNIVWQNRQFYFKVEAGIPGDPAAPGIWGLCPDIGGTIEGLECPDNDPVYDDLAVLGTTGTLACDPADSCILTGALDPLFVQEYVNGNRSSVFQPEITTAIQAPPAFDEGGNFIRPRFGPLALYNDATPNDGDPGTLFGDYDIQGGSSAIDEGIDLTGTYPDLATDYHRMPRPSGSGVDIGAVEFQ